MKTVTRAGLVLATMVLTVGLVGSPASARADTSWGGCCSRVQAP